LSRLTAFLSGKSLRVATRAAETLSVAIEGLNEFAERARSEPVHGLRELVVRFGRDAYIVQYRVEATLVIVARVFHSREDRSSVSSLPIK